MSIALSTSSPSFDVNSVLTPYAPDTTVFNPIVLTEMLGYHPLTRPFTNDIVHSLNYEADLVSLDHKVASGLYQCLCDIFYAIHKAGTTDADLILKNNSDVVFHLPPVPDYQFTNAGLGVPAILGLMPRFTQNPFLIAGSREYIRKVYCLAQVVGMNSLEWIAKARMICARDANGYGWRWENLDREEGIAGLGPTTVNSLIEAPAALRTENNVRDLIIHPRYSNWARLHPEYDPARPLLERGSAGNSICYQCPATSTNRHTAVLCHTARAQLDAPEDISDADNSGSEDGTILEYGTEYSMESEEE